MLVVNTDDNINNFGRDKIKSEMLKLYKMKEGYMPGTAFKMPLQATLISHISLCG